MCGIVGYLGKGEAYPALIKGLKRLEYADTILRELPLLAMTAL